MGLRRIDWRLGNGATLTFVGGRIAIAHGLVGGDAIQLQDLGIDPGISVDRHGGRRDLEHQTFGAREVDRVAHPVIDVAHHVDTARSDAVPHGEQLLRGVDVEGEVLCGSGSGGTSATAGMADPELGIDLVVGRKVDERHGTEVVETEEAVLAPWHAVHPEQTNQLSSEHIGEELDLSLHVGSVDREVVHAVDASCHDSHALTPGTAVSQRMARVGQVPTNTQPTTTLLLARHGQSTRNAEKRWQGQADPPLSIVGREQAASASAAVGAVELIAASPQLRALETAMIISDMIGVGPVLSVDDLRERSAGSWSGLTRDDIDEQFPGWLSDGRRPDDFETDDEVLTRVLPALDAVAAESPGGSILVVCHGGVIRTIETNLGIEEGRVPNLSGRVLTSSTPGRWTAGEQMQLIDAERSTGGDGLRV